MGLYKRRGINGHQTLHVTGAISLHGEQAVRILAVRAEYHALSVGGPEGARVDCRIGRQTAESPARDVVNPQVGRRS